LDNRSNDPALDDGSAVEERPFRAASSAKKENNSILPKAVAAERSSEATQIFQAFVKAGRRLAEIHVHYEQQPEYKLTKRGSISKRFNAPRTTPTLRTARASRSQGLKPMKMGRATPG
jgi:hypothetical protein